MENIGGWGLDEMRGYVLTKIKKGKSYKLDTRKISDNRKNDEEYKQETYECISIGKRFVTFKKSHGFIENFTYQELMKML